MFNLKINTYLKLIFIISLTSLVAAYFIEYVLGHQPCNLCLIERIPYTIGIILISINLIFNTNQKFLILLLIMTFTFSILISFYHFGIEQGFFDESMVCSLNNSKNIITKEEILKQLSEITISCKDVTFRIFGFSLTSINILLNLFLVILLAKIFKDYEKFKT
tara:strand:- start:152 stop:640 length:489 start_codon:yes stop_codon:yes gene_type:complete